MKTRFFQRFRIYFIFAPLLLMALALGACDDNGDTDEGLDEGLNEPVTQQVG